MNQKYRSAQQQQTQRYVAYQVERGRQIETSENQKAQEQTRERDTSAAPAIGLSTVKRGKDPEEPERGPGR